MRRLLPALLVLGAALVSSPVTAQDQPVSLLRFELLEQSPWNGPQADRRTVRARLLIENLSGSPLDDLTLGHEVRAAPRGRLEYEESLSTDPTVLLFGGERTVRPVGDGEAIEVPFTLNLAPLIERGVSAVYPMKLELRSDDVPVATIRSPIVFLVPEEEIRPLAVAAVVVLAERLHQDATGAFVDRALEAIVPQDGWLGATADLLAEAGGDDLTLAVSPLLLRQLEAMGGGYRVDGEEGETVPRSAPAARAAREVLQDLARAAAEGGPGLAAYPLAAPSLPALALGGLDRDIANQLGRGADLVERLLGRRPDPGLIRPPFGLIDTGSLAELEALGHPGTALLLDPGTATPPEEEQGFNPVASGRLQVGDAPGLPAILPSSSLDSTLEAIPEDPVLRAQAALGELAVIHGEQPGIGARGVALLVGETDPVEPAFLRALLAGLRDTPVLRPLAARAFLDELNSRAPLQVDTNRTFRTFTSEYEEAIRAARADIGRFRAAFPGASDRAAELRELVLVAEGQQFIRSEEAGRSFLEQVARAKTDRASAITLPPTGQVFTLASRNLGLPIRLRNETGGRVHVRVTLVAPGLRFAEDTQDYDFEEEARTQTFDVQATRGGRFPVAVLMCAPVGDGPCEPGSPDELGRSRIVIRSTVYNRVALILTVGAALFLLVGYVRRVVRRRTAG